MHFKNYTQKMSWWILLFALVSHDLAMIIFDSVEQFCTELIMFMMYN